MQQIFRPEKAEEIPEIPLQVMTIPFDKEEIQKAAKSLKNNRSVGIDSLKLEMIKCIPPIICEGIAEILDTIAKTREHIKK